MSAEEEETGVAGEPPAPADRSKITPAGKKPALAKKRAVAKKPAAAKGPAAEPEETAAATKEPIPAKKEPTATKKPAAESKATRSASAKPSRRRVVRARARYVRTSARKARMVSGHLRGKTVSEARAILAFTPREVARDWSKLLESAVANAENNHELIENDLVVREAYADEGPTIKRFRPRAMGRATPIHKRTSHLTITLTPGS